MKTNTNQIKAFTLIELLVVVTIIGILSGMGIAQFQSSIKKANLAKAQSAYAQFKKKALAQNALLDNKLFTAWYSFDQDSSLSTIEDASVHNNFLQKSGREINSDTGVGAGNSLFMPSGHAIRGSTTRSNRPVDKITIATWMKASGESMYTPIIDTGAGFRIRNNVLNFYSTNTPAEYIPKEIEIDTWYFVVGSYDGVVSKFWVNGDFVGQKTSPSLDINRPIYLGNFNGGYLDEVMIMPYAWNGIEFE